MNIIHHFRNMACPVLAFIAIATLSMGAKPNIVVIFADDLGYGDLGSYNQQAKIPTPHLDRLATQGIRLTDAHAAASVCSPSRYGLLTGHYPWRPLPPGVTAEGGRKVAAANVGVWAEPIIPQDRLTLPKLLQKHGYATAAIGKWHLGWKWPTRDGKPPRTGPDNLTNIDFTRPIGEGPITLGFDYYFGTCVPNFPPYCFIEQDRTVGIPTEPTTEFERPGPKIPGWSQQEIMPELTRRAVRYIENAAHSGKPFFLYFALTSPHHPIVPTPEFRGTSEAGEYGDFVVQSDWSAGQVIAALERSGLAENTLVIFTSDNGPEITRNTNPGDPIMAVGAYDRIQKYGHASMGPLRGTKYEVWEGGHRVPFIARWPGRFSPGSVSDELLCLTDLFATCAEIIDAEIPFSAAEDSFNALPVLLGGKGTRSTAVLKSSGDTLAVRQGEWVYINAAAGVKPEPKWIQAQRGYTPNQHPGQLYNLSEDIAERDNLYGSRPDKVMELKALLEKYRSEGRSRPATP